MEPNNKADLIKVEYEVMHSSVEELSRSHNIPESVIRTYIKDEGWKQLGDEAKDQQLEVITDKMQSMSVFNQAALTRSFLSLQSKILTVSHSLLDEVTSLSDAPFLKIVSEVIELHRPHILGPNGSQGGGSGGGLRIQVISQFGNGDNAMTNAVQITDSAGLSNGIGALEQGM